jgi:ELWxxDGT repeat protein
LVRDINPGGGGSAPSFLTNVGGTLYLSARDGADGKELWRSDGTEAGTTLVRDIHPGGAGSAPKFLTNVGGTLYFNADDGTHGAELWEAVP